MYRLAKRFLDHADPVVDGFRRIEEDQWLRSQIPSDSSAPTPDCDLVSHWMRDRSKPPPNIDLLLKHLSVDASELLRLVVNLCRWLEPGPPPGSPIEAFLESEAPGVDLTERMAGLVRGLQLRVVEKLSAITTGPSQRPLDGDDRTTWARRRQEIVHTIRAAGCRLTTMPLISAMARAEREHSESAVRHDLAGLVKEGVLTNCRKCRPPGYGLPEWTRPHGQGESAK
jgi:hypothetical protein